MRLAIELDSRGATDVDESKLTSLEEEVGPGVPSELTGELNRLLNGHDSAHNDSIDLAVGEGDLIRLKEVLDQEVSA